MSNKEIISNKEPKFTLQEDDGNYIKVRCEYKYLDNDLSINYYISKLSIEPIERAKEHYYRDLASGYLKRYSKKLLNTNYTDFELSSPKKKACIIITTALILSAVGTGGYFLVNYLRNKNIGPEDVNFKYRLKNDDSYEVVKWKSVNNTIADIPLSVNGKKVTSIGDNVFEGNKYLKSVNFSKNLKVVGSSAFKDCTNLENVTYYNNSESNEFESNLVEIKSFAFSGCSSLKDIYLPTSLTTIGSFAFEDDVSLKNTYIPKNVIDVGDFVFEGCYNAVILIENDVIPTTWSFNWNSSERPYMTNISDINCVYEKNDAIYYNFDNETAWLIASHKDYNNEKNIELSLDVDNKKITKIAPNAFPSSSYYPYVKTISIHNVDNNLTIGDGAFASFINANIFLDKDLEDTDWKTRYETSSNYGKVYTNVVSLFEDNYAKYVLLDDNTAHVYDAVDGVSNISIRDEITYNSNKYKVTSIAPHAFAFNKTITSLDATESLNLTSVGAYAFEDTNKLISVAFSSSLQFIDDYAFIIRSSLNESGVYYNGVTSIDFGNSNIKRIGYGAFKKNEESITIEKITTPFIYNKITFKYSILTIKNFNTSSLIDIGTNAFYNCGFEENFKIDLANNFDLKEIDGLTFNLLGYKPIFIYNLIDDTSLIPEIETQENEIKLNNYVVQNKWHWFIFDNDETGLDQYGIHKDGNCYRYCYKYKVIESSGEVIKRDYSVFGYSKITF